MRGETRSDLLHQVRIFLEEVFLDSSYSKAHCAETMQNWDLEAAHLRHLGVNVKWIDIPAESIEEGLILLNFLLRE